MESTVNKVASEVRRTAGSVDFAFTLFLIQLIAMIPLSYYYNGYFDREVALLYMMIVMGCYLYGRNAERVINRVNPWRALIAGLIGAALTWASVLVLFVFVLKTDLGKTPVAQIWALIATQAVFVAPGEELSFRVAIPTYLESLTQKKSLKIVALLISQAGFAFFHYAVYGGFGGAMIMAFMIGCLWLFLLRFNWKKVPFFRDIEFLQEPLGVGFTIGAHAVYNLTLAGILIWGITA